MLIISSFNIRCFGLGGEYSGRFRDEKRHFNLKNMIHKELSHCDVMIFQEIVDVESFKMIIPNNFNLYDYGHEYKRHQNVVIAIKETHKVLKQDVVPLVAIDKKFSRPALHLKIQLNTKLNQVFNIIGVHLKSGNLHTENRLKQAKAIADYIELLGNKNPCVIGGDFNTHKIESSSLEFDDTKYMADIFQTIGLEFIENEIPTFQTKWSQNFLDHFWISKKLTKNSELKVYDASTKNISLDDYYQNISDHVPIILRINDFK